jgi:hypothetical protein
MCMIFNDPSIPDLAHWDLAAYVNGDEDHVVAAP